MNSNNSVIPAAQQNTDSTNNEQQCFRWVPDNLSSISNIKKNISGEEKGFSKQKFEVWLADKTGGNINLRWKPDQMNKQPRWVD